MGPFARLCSALVIAAIGLAAGRCASAGGPGRPAPFPGTPVNRAVTASPGAAAALATVIRRALDLRGTPYRFGGERPETGLDCSGLVRHVFGTIGIDLPRTVVEQYETGARIGRRDLRPGDLVFFDTARPGPSHVGIAIDATSFVHAPGSGGVVRVDQLSAPYWESRIRGIRRVAGDGAAADALTP